MDLPILVDALSFYQDPMILIVDKRLLKNLCNYFDKSPARRPIRESFYPIHPIDLIHPIHAMHPIHPIHPIHSIHPIHQIHPLHLEAPPRRSLRYVCASEQPAEIPSLSSFKNEYHRLELKKLLCVQYSTNYGERKFLFGGISPKYRCNLCGYEVGTDLKTHMNGIIHSERLQLLTEMYDPRNAIWLHGIPEIKNESILEDKNHETALENKQRNKALENKQNNEEPIPSSFLNIFRKNYLHLADDKLLNVQYSFNFKDREFMVGLYHGRFYCNMCSCFSSSIIDLRNHLKGARHTKQVDKTVEMYGPLDRVLLESSKKVDEEEKILEIKQQEKILEQKNHETTLEEKLRENTLENKQNNEKLKPSSFFNIFKKDYLHLTYDKLLNVQYSFNFKDRKFMVGLYHGRLCCNMCGCFLSSTIDLRSHLKGARHTKQVDKTVEMYDPLDRVWLQSAKKVDEEQKRLENKQLQTPLVNQRQEQTREIEQLEKTQENKQSNEELNPLSLLVFKSSYFYLAYEKLLNVQYSFNYKDREFMIIDKKVCLHCIMCGCDIYSTTGLQAHFKGIPHSRQVEKAVEMYDPMKCVWLQSAQIEQEPSVENNVPDSSSLLSLFKTEYRQLELAHLLNVQYSINGEKKIMIEHVNSQYECKLCFCKLESVYSLKNHFNELIHTQRVEYLKEMYDPINCIWLKDKQKGENLQKSSNDALSEIKTQYDEFKIKCSTSCVAGFQYKLNDCEEWSDVLSQHGAFFLCNFCNVNKKRLRSFMTMFSHINSISHWNNVPKTAEIFHPEYCLQSLSRETNRTTRSSNKSYQTSGKQPKSHFETKKHNLDEFKKFYVNLPIEELLQVQYQVKNEEWDFLLDESNQRYYCRLCQNVELAHEKSVKDHIGSLYHSLNVNELPAMYHPIYCVCWDIESSSHDELRWGLYERNDFKINSCNADVDIVLEEFKKNYIDLNLDELLNVQYQLNDNDWEFMFTELFDGYYCNLCEIFLHDFEFNVDIHILGEEHLNHIKNLTALYHPEYCTFESDDYVEENRDATSNSYDDEVLDPILRQFTMDYVNLNTDEIMQIAYEIVENGGWDYMINVKNKRFFCNLCGNISLGTNYEMERHIREESHINKVKSVLGLYHPTYCFADMDENEDSESIYSTCSEVLDESTNCLPFNLEKTANSLKCAPSDLLVLPKELSSNVSSGSQSDILIYEELDTLSTDDAFFKEHSILDESTTSDDI